LLIGPASDYAGFRHLWSFRDFTEIIFETFEEDFRAEALVRRGNRQTAQYGERYPTRVIAAELGRGVSATEGPRASAFAQGSVEEDNRTYCRSRAGRL